MSMEAEGPMVVKAWAAVAGHCKGIWAYLARREQRRQAVETHRENRLRDVELENARTAGTTAIIRELRHGGEVFEIDPGGRSRVIRMPERPLPPPVQMVIEPGQQHRLDGPSPRGELTP